MTKLKRQSGIELLRIIAMLQIIFLHIFQYGNLKVALSLQNNPANFIVTLMWCLSRTPVDVFVMISGYFLVTSEFDIKKTLNRSKKIYLSMIFYSIIISAIFFIATPEIIDVPNVIKTFLPFISRMWYFLNNYIIILLISPFLNRMIYSLSKKQYLYFLGILFAVISVWATFAKIDGIKDVVSTAKVLDNYYGKSLGGFLLMYVIGGYLRLFVPKRNIKNSSFKVHYFYILTFFILCVTDLALYIFLPQYKKVCGMFNNPLVLLESICLILFFRDMNFSSNIVNLIASTTLGVYTIHEHPFVRKWLWSLISLKDKSLYDNFNYIPFIFAVCISIFFVCFIIELIRLQLFKFVPNIIKKLTQNTKK